MILGTAESCKNWRSLKKPIIITCWGPLARFLSLPSQKEDAINLPNRYDNHVLQSAEMYDHLLLEADTEYRRLTAAYDSITFKQMARIDLEMLKSIAHIARINPHQPLCHNVHSSFNRTRTLYSHWRPHGIDNLVNNLKQRWLPRARFKITYSKKRELVEIALRRLSTHRMNIVKRLIERSKPTSHRSATHQ